MLPQLKNLKFLLWFTVVLTAFWRIIAAQPYRGHYFDSICTDAQTGRELFIGESYTRPGQCIQIQCLGDLTVWEDNCQIPTLQGNCTRIPSSSSQLGDLEYPKCCPTYVCKTYTTNKNVEMEETSVYDHHGRLLKSHLAQVFTFIT